jgi:hypothetical protein
LEGNLASIPEECPSQLSTSTITFNIVSSRFTKSEQGIDRHDSTFTIQTRGHLADRCLAELSLGRGVRVVGSLSVEPAGQVIIIAEHIEFKPIQISNPSDEQ